MNLFDKLTDGLRLYEVVLLLLGSIMFLALVIMLIIYSAQRRRLKPLFMFFAVPVLMIVWPSIQKIRIDGKGAEIEKQIAEVQKNPSEENKDRLSELLTDVERRDVKNPDVVKDVAVAQYVLGNEKAAEETMESLPPSTKDDPKMTELRRSITLSSQLRAQVTAVQQNPADSGKIRELDRLQQQAATLSIKNPTLVKELATAQYLIGNTRAAEQTIRTLSPKEAATSEVKNIRTSIAVTNQLKSQIEAVKEAPRDSNEIKELNRLQLEASRLAVKNTEVTKSIRVANEQVTNYKRINPRVRVTTIQQR
jgi:thioredoxin-like negative regulator of GroEL